MKITIKIPEIDPTEGIDYFDLVDQLRDNFEAELEKYSIEQIKFCQVVGFNMAKNSIELEITPQE